MTESRPPNPAAPDVVVIGGGPAGSTAAALLAAWGRRVVLITRPPARRALAESLPPSCARLFDRVGIRAIVDDAGFIRSTGNAVQWGKNALRVERFAAGALGWQVRRDVLDHLLVAHAEASGATVLRDATARDVTPGGAADLSLVSYDAGGEARALSAAWVLDCTGRAGLAGARRWRRDDATQRTLALVGVWERASGDAWPMDDHTQTLVESYEGGWAWSVPVSPERRYLTVMVDPSLTPVRGGEALTATYERELARTTALRRLAAGATLVGEPWARDASSYSSSQAAEPGLLVAGDAASFVDPLSSYGVKKAIASAWLAAVVTHTCLGNGALMGPALAFYEERERLMYDELRRHTVELSGEARAAHAGSFWKDRAEPDDEDDRQAEPDVAALRTDERVLAAFDALKREPVAHLHQSRALERVNRATVRGHQVVLMEHLVAPDFPGGVRYLRGVDLVHLVELAPSHDQVPDLFEAYNRSSPPVALPDFLGALSVLIGMKMVVLE